MVTILLGLPSMLPKTYPGLPWQNFYGNQVQQTRHQLIMQQNWFWELSFLNLTELEKKRFDLA